MQLPFQIAFMRAERIATDCFLRCFLKRKIREVNISVTVVSSWSAEVPRTPEESVRYRNISSWQEEENIWNNVSRRCQGEMEASCDRGEKGETKETEQGGVEGTGLAFIAFTEVMALFPASPFWSTLFFLMLLNLGLSTMFGTMQGILTPLMDNFSLLGRHRTLLTVSSCALGFLLGLLFTQRSGNYFVTMFDDYSATLPLVIVVVFETISVAWVYGTDRFLDDIEEMLKWRPPVVYKYLWKYVCLLAMIGLLAASLLRMVFKRPTYTAWNQSTASEMTLEYPGWALAMIVMLIVFASLPVPMGYIHSMLKNRTSGNTCSEELGGQELHRELYTKCSSTDQLDSNSHQVPTEEEEALPRTGFLPMGNEHYRLLPQQEEEDEEEDTGV